jgi:hypothetical protein
VRLRAGKLRNGFPVPWLPMLPWGAFGRVNPALLKQFET